MPNSSDQWAAPDTGESAFGVSGDVTWDTGFGAEDLAGSAPAPAKPVAPRPAEPPAPSPSVAPAAPRADLVADTEVPEWAQVRPEPVVPVVEGPPQPGSTLPPIPAPTPVVAPVVPAQVHVPQTFPPAPVTPAPVERWEQPVSEPAAASQTPAYAQPQYTQPQYEQPRYEEPRYEHATPAAPPAQYDLPPTPEPAAEPEAKPSRLRGKNAKSKTPKKGTSLSGGFAGGRWKVKIFRGLVYSLMVLLLIGGLRNIIAPKTGPSADEIAAQVRTSLGDTGFPTAAAEGFTVRFAKAYLTYDPAKAEERTQALAVYSPEAADGLWGWTGSDGKQDVVTGPFVAAKPVTTDKNNAYVIVAAQVTSGAWVYLSVPLYASDTGGLVVSGAPAFVAPPARATSPGGPNPTADDDTLVQVLTTDVLPGYFKAWAASGTVDLQRYTTPDATPAATTGLAGVVTLGQIGEVHMPREGGDVRTGEVSVQWKTQTAGTYAQSYKITVSKDASGRWSVKDIVGGVVSPSGTTTGDAGSPTPTPEATPADGVDQ